MSENYEINKTDIPLAMQVLEIKTKEVFAEALGITSRSLGDETMAKWRQMSIECLLRREGKWDLFCQLRGDTVPSPAPTSKVVYKCIVCDRCLGQLQEIPTLPGGKGGKSGKGGKGSE